MKWISLLLTLAIAGCASSGAGGWRMPDSADVPSDADPAAYGADTMTFRKDMPGRDAVPWEFYYKHCALNGDRDVYSVDSYDCSGPSF